MQVNWSQPFSIPVLKITLVSIRKWMGEPILWYVRLRRTHHKIGTLRIFGQVLSLKRLDGFVKERNYIC